MMTTRSTHDYLADFCSRRGGWCCCCCRPSALSAAPDQHRMIPQRAKPWLGMGALGASAFGIALVFTPVKEGYGPRTESMYIAYPDPVTHGKPYTICKGHTKHVHAGDKATEAQCRKYLEEDLQDASVIVHRCIHVPLNVNQEAALIDVTFHEGPSVVCGSRVQLAANAGNYAGMCANMARYLFANHEFVKGFIDRRVDDIELCGTPVTKPTRN